MFVTSPLHGDQFWEVKEKISNSKTANLIHVMYSIIIYIFFYQCSALIISQPKACTIVEPMELFLLFEAATLSLYHPTSISFSWDREKGNNLHKITRLVIIGCPSGSVYKWHEGHCGLPKSRSCHVCVWTVFSLFRRILKRNLFWLSFFTNERLNYTPLPFEWHLRWPI